MLNVFIKGFQDKRGQVFRIIHGQVFPNMWWQKFKNYFSVGVNHVECNGASDRLECCFIFIFFLSRTHSI
jgi:hypothetical protein